MIFISFRGFCQTDTSISSISRAGQYSFNQFKPTYYAIQFTDGQQTIRIEILPSEYLKVAKTIQKFFKKNNIKSKLTITKNEW